MQSLFKNLPRQIRNELIALAHSQNFAQLKQQIESNPQIPQHERLNVFGDALLAFEEIEQDDYHDQFTKMQKLQVQVYGMILLYFD